MELNKGKIIISILKSKNNKEFLKKKDNLLIFILLFERYNCIHMSEVEEIIGRKRKLTHYLDKAHERLLLNKDFRQKFLFIEKKISEIT